jgi:hypothetical protein
MRTRSAALFGKSFDKPDRPVYRLAADARRNRRPAAAADAGTDGIAGNRHRELPRSGHREPDDLPKRPVSWVLIGAGLGISWPELDEDISVDGLLRGERSGESPSSLRSWRATRRRPANKALPPTSRTARTRSSKGHAARG